LRYLRWGGDNEAVQPENGSGVGKSLKTAQNHQRQVHAVLGALFFRGIDQNIISPHQRTLSKSPETTDSARAAHIPDTLATLPAVFGLPARF
jgi:hypothetical protein